jgi:hypothetical protein
MMSEKDRPDRSIEAWQLTCTASRIKSRVNVTEDRSVPKKDIHVLLVRGGERVRPRTIRVVYVASLTKHSSVWLVTLAAEQSERK